MFRRPIFGPVKEKVRSSRPRQLTPFVDAREEIGRAVFEGFLIKLVEGRNQISFLGGHVEMRRI